MEILVHKESLVSTELILKIVKKFELVTLLEDSTKRFLNISFDNDKLSLTHNQSMATQLRFYNESFALEAMNKIAIIMTKKVNGNIIFLIYSNQLSPIEQFFLNRLRSLSKNRITYRQISVTDKISMLEYSYEKMRYFQNIGDNWTASRIGDFLINVGSLSKDSNFLKDYSFNFMELGDPLASKAVLEHVIKNIDVNSSVENNEALIGCYYALGLLYIRNLPKVFRDEESALYMLEKARSYLEDPNFLFDNDKRIFSWVFNRNGYALILFYRNQYEDTINLMLELISKLEKVVKRNSFAKLHLSVLHYNLFQVYNAMEDDEKAEKELKIVMSMDPNDREYKYDYIRFLFKNGKLDKAKIILDEMYTMGIDDPVFHSSYYGQYYIEKKNFKNAVRYCKQAVIYNYDNNKINIFIYNYIVSLINANEVTKEILDWVSCLVEKDILMYTETYNLIQSAYEYIS